MLFPPSRVLTGIPVERPSTTSTGNVPESDPFSTNSLPGKPKSMLQNKLHVNPLFEGNDDKRKVSSKSCLETTNTEKG